MEWVIVGVSLYVNNSFYEVYETPSEAFAMSIRYGSQQISVLPMMGWRDTTTKEISCHV